MTRLIMLFSNNLSAKNIRAIPDFLINKIFSVITLQAKSGLYVPISNRVYMCNTSLTVEESILNAYMSTH